MLGSIFGSFRDGLRSRGLFSLGAILGICALASGFPPSAKAQQGTFVPTGSMSVGRAPNTATATLLPNGKVLIAGGSDVVSGSVVSSAELYDPATGQFTFTGNMTAARAGHTATLLKTGKVLIAGGEGPLTTSPPLCLCLQLGPGTAAELYDPTTETFTATGVMASAMIGHTANLLNDGTVLLAGGEVCEGSHCADPEPESYDPSTGSFTALSTTNGNFGGLVGEVSVLLSNGKIFLAGGDDVLGFDAPEVYDPATGTTAIVQMPAADGSLEEDVPRYYPSLTNLQDGKVLIAGADAASLGPAGTPSTGRVYDPATNTATQLENMITYRSNHTATLLQNGLVLLAGGLGAPDQLNEGTPIASSEVYDETTNTFSATGNLVTARTGAMAVLLNNGTVLIAGGGTASAELFENNAVGPGPIVSLSPVTVGFGAQILGVSSALQTVTLTNTGKSNLSIQGFSLVGANAGDFIVGNGSSCASGVTVAANGSCTIEVSFLPTALGTRTASITILDNGAYGLSTLPLSGMGAPVAGLTVTPPSISFSAQYVGTSGNPQSLTVTNTGTIALNIVSLTASPSDFGVLNACGSTVAVGASCSIGVFFDPTVGGARSGTLTISDNGTGGSQTVTLSGSGQDFSMVAGSGGSATVSAGQTANYTVSVAPAGGFAQSVSLGCSGAPAGATCTVTPSMVTVSTSASMVNVAVTTTARSMGMPLELGNRQMRMMLLMAGASLFWMLVMLQRRFARREMLLRWAPVVAMVLLACFAMTLSSCGGGSSPSGGGGALGTQAGNYTITVTGNFSGGSANLSHATKLTLVVH
jgi:hypothetical protein